MASEPVRPRIADFLHRTNGFGHVGSIGRGAAVVDSPAPRAGTNLHNVRASIIAGVLSRIIMPTYPKMTEPLPPGFVTLDDWAPEVRRKATHIRDYWTHLPGWPDPLGQVPPRGADRRGRWRPVYRLADLQAFLQAHPELQADLKGWDLPVGLDRSKLLTLTGFAKLAGKDSKTVHQQRKYAGFPEPVDQRGTQDLFVLGDLIDFFGTGRGLRPDEAGESVVLRWSETYTARASRSELETAFGGQLPADLTASPRRYSEPLGAFIDSIASQRAASEGAASRQIRSVQPSRGDQATRPRKRSKGSGSA